MFQIKSISADGRWIGIECPKYKAFIDDHIEDIKTGKRPNWSITLFRKAKQNEIDRHLFYDRVMDIVNSED